MTHVGVTGFGYRVVVHVDDAVEVARDDFGDVVQLLEVVDAIVDEGRECEGCEVADSGLVGGGILRDLGTEVGRLDDPEVLLVGFAWTRAT